MLVFGLGLQLQAQDVQWQKKMGGKNADYLYDAIPTLDYGFIMVGGTQSNQSGNVKKNAGSFDFFITKVSEKGDLLWTKTLGGKQADIARCIVNSLDGGFLLAGISSSDISYSKTCEHIGQRDIWLVKYDINGSIIWQKTLGGYAVEQISQVIRTTDGGFLIAGSSASNEFIPTGVNMSSPNLVIKQGDNYGSMDYWLVKINAEGEMQWQKTFGGKYKDILKQVVELPNQDIILAGSSNSPKSGNKTTNANGRNDWWLVKINETGDLLWQKSYGTDAEEKLSTMLVTKDDHILLGGNYVVTNGETKKRQADIKLLKINFEGDIIWKETYDNGGDDFLTNIVQNSDGTLVLGAYTGSHAQSKFKLATASKGMEDYLIIKTKANGEEKWRRSLGTKKKEVLRKVIETRDGGYALLGSSVSMSSIGEGDADFLIIKIGDKDKPKHPKLPLEAVPNPAVDYTQAVIGKEYENGQVKVVDLNGKIIEQFEINGERIIPIHLANYKMGIYIINVTADKMKNSVKVIKGH